MKIWMMPLVMSAFVGIGVASQPSSTSSLEANTSTNPLLAEDNTSPQAMNGLCPGVAPCCEFDDTTGHCTVRMICFAGLWQCP